jgi:hypothetical protein
VWPRRKKCFCLPRVSVVSVALGNSVQRVPDTELWSFQRVLRPRVSPTSYQS